LRSQLASLGAINQEQWVVIAALCTFALGVLTQAWHHIDVAWISGLALILLLVSGVLTKQRFREGLDWPTIFFLVGNGCLVNVMDYVGFSQVLAELVNRWLGFTSASIWLVYCCLPIGHRRCATLPAAQRRHVGGVCGVTAAGLGSGP